MNAASVTLRVLPDPIRDALIARTDSRAHPVSSALALAASNRRAEAVGVLTSAAQHAEPEQLRRIVAAAAALDEPDLALHLLQRLPLADPERDRLTALAYQNQGWLREADGAAARAGRQAHRLRRRIRGELNVLMDEPRQPPKRRDRDPVSSTATHPLRVLHLVTNALPEVTAGYTVRTQGIVRAQRARGIDAHVVSRLGFPVTAGFFGAPAKTEVDGVPYHRLLPLRWLPAAADATMAIDVGHTTQLTRRMAPDLLHAHSKHLNAQVALTVRERTGVPVVYEVRGFLEETWRSRGHDVSSDSYQLARQIETRCMLAADAVVTIAEAMRAEILTRGVPPERVSVVPNAVDSTFLAPAPDPAALRAELGIHPDDVVLGVVTTLNAYEGISTLIDALRLLRERGAPVKLLIVGSGAERAPLAAAAHRAGLTDAIVMTGHVPHEHIRTYHAAIDIFCVTRVSSPVTRLVTPLKPLEAMATGRPVVASDLPPLREIVQPGVTGALSTPEDPQDIADVIEPLVYDSTVRGHMGDAAREWVGAHRTWAAAADRYGAVYEQIAPRGAGAPSGSATTAEE